MRPTPRSLALVLVLGAGLVGCGDQTSSSGDGCTEFAGQEDTIGIRHAHGLSPEDGGETPTGEGKTRLGDLVRPGDGDDLGALLSVYDSKASPGKPGLDAHSAITQQIDRTGSGEYWEFLEPLETAEVEVAGMPARRATLATTDDIVYTAWILEGEQRSLDIVLAQSKDSRAEIDLADKVPGLVRDGGCG